MIKLVFPSPLIEHLRAAMATSPLETCAILSTYPAVGGRLLVREGTNVPESAYCIRTAETAALRPEYVFEAVRRARDANCGIVFVHSHPNSEHRCEFSSADDDGEFALAEYLRQRLPNHEHVALLIGKHRMTARRLATHEAVGLEECGSRVRFAFPAEEGELDAYAEIYDRQVRAFGIAGQRLLNRLRIGIVGLGGTGSIIALQLAYLGVRNFLLIDPQTLDKTNRNRVVGTRPDDIGRPKAELAKRHILEISPSAVIDIDTAERGVLNPICCQKLRTVNFVFVCTDTHASRAAVCKLCYQFLIGGIDVGVNINAENGSVKAITGRVQMMAAGLPCLLCTSSIHPDAIRKELMSPEQRATDPYFTGEGEPQPAVISINGTMCSLAVTMFLAAVTGIPGEARHQRYDGLKGVVRPVLASADSRCLLCSSSGTWARGDSSPVSFP